MAFDFKAGTITEKATTGNQAYTGVGFQPKAVLFVFSVSSGADAYFGLGVASSSTSESSLCIYSADNSGTSVSSRRTDQGDSCVLLVGESVVISQGNLVSLDADGFTLNFTTVSGSSLEIQYYAFGGADLTNAAHLAFDSKTSTGNQAYTGVGFQPDFAFFFAALNDTDNTNEGSNLLSFGGAVSSTERFACGLSSQTGLGTSNTNRKQVTDKCITLPWAGSGAVLEEADFVSFDADGFTLNWTASLGDGRECFALCFKGGQYKIGTETQKTSTGTKATTGVGFQPTGLLLASVCNVNSASIVDNARMVVGGANSATSRVCHWIGDGDNLDTTACDRNTDTANVIQMLTEGTPTLDAEADLSSFDSDGFTLDWGTADATAREFVYVAFGSEGGGSSVLTADPGSYAITGTDASLEQGYEVQADPGSFSISGTDVNLNQGYEVAADIGSYETTGVNANLVQGYEVSADPGSYVISGTDPSLEWGRNLGAEVGSYIISGVDVNLIAGDTLVTDPGSYSIVGTEPSLEQGYELGAEVGSYLVTGTEPNLEQGYLLRAGDPGTNEGPNYGTATNDASVGVQAWNDPNFAEAEDGVNAVAFSSGGPALDSNYLRVVDFGFTPPANSEIVGMEVAVYRSKPSGANPTEFLGLVVGGVVVGSEVSQAISVMGETVFGSSTSLPAFGVSLTDSDIDANFGVVYRGTADPAFNILSVDYIRITLYYAGTSGSYSLAGQSVSFSEGVSLVADPGSYAITGVDVSLKKQLRLSAAVGVYVITGVNAELLKAGDEILGGQFVAGQVYIPGFQFAEIYLPGFKAGDVLN